MDNRDRRKLRPNPVKNPDLKQVKRNKASYRREKRYYGTWHPIVAAVSAVAYWAGALLLGILEVKTSGLRFGSPPGEIFNSGDVIALLTILYVHNMLYRQYLNRTK